MNFNKKTHKESNCMKVSKLNKSEFTSLDYILNLTNNSYNYYANDEYDNILQVSFCVNLSGSCKLKILFISKL